MKRHVLETEADSQPDDEDKEFQAAYNRIKTQFRNETKSRTSKQNDEALPYIFRNQAHAKNEGLYKPREIGGVPNFN